MATPPQELLADASCYTCLGLSPGDAMKLVLWDRISRNIAPDGETFYILSNAGDALVSQAGDNLVYQ